MSDESAGRSGMVPPWVDPWWVALVDEVNKNIAPARIERVLPSPASLQSGGAMPGHADDRWYFRGRWGTFHFDFMLDRDPRLKFAQWRDVIEQSAASAVENAVQTLVRLQVDSLKEHTRTRFQALETTQRDLESRLHALESAVSGKNRRGLWSTITGGW